MEGEKKSILSRLTQTLTTVNLRQPKSYAKGLECCKNITGVISKPSLSTGLHLALSFGGWNSLGVPSRVSCTLENELDSLVSVRPPDEDKQV